MEVTTLEVCRPGSMRQFSPSAIANEVPGDRESVSSPGMRPSSHTDCASGSAAPAPWMASHTSVVSAISTSVM